MFKVIENLNESADNTIPMNELEAGQVAEIVEGSYKGRIVVAVHHGCRAMYLVLNCGWPDSFDDKCSIRVKLLKHPITVQFSND